MKIEEIGDREIREIRFLNITSSSTEHNIQQMLVF
tara:strand:- start:400 stop:504 length:105 start_codon:yes stop_codon:yes gene_type:complete